MKFFKKSFFFAFSYEKDDHVSLMQDSIFWTQFKMAFLTFSWVNELTTKRRTFIFGKGIRQTNFQTSEDLIIDEDIFSFPLIVKFYVQEY